MYNIYDDGYYMLGRCDKLKHYTNTLIKNNDGDIEMCNEILKDLTDNYDNEDILLINYDCSMGYYIEKVFKKRDVVFYD